ATLIGQMPGEGNRMHFHLGWDEWWYIVEGQWEWIVDGISRNVSAGDVIFIERNRRHKIIARGDKMAIRLAVSRQDVEHIYQEQDYSEST
ncbi:MAG: cupin domain-containing protein, partial [Candidatus Omnitrophica bacterium]|nr:cupin domain-containing protein [Candidatus Omnitrophota bacterium]